MLSVVIPSYNEEAMIPITARTVAGVLAGAGIACELLFVDDGSKDGTWRAIQTAAAENPAVRGLRFSRNFGKEAAIFAGLEAARGQAVAVLDCDLQHPPEKLPEMYRLWQEGYQVVEGVKADRGAESGLHAAAARSFYALISRAMRLDLQDSSDYKLMDRAVVDALTAMPERGVFFRALSYWVGFRRAEVRYAVQPRAAGQSKWSARSLIRYAFANLSAFSSAPMQLVTWLGALFCVFALVLGMQTLVRLALGHAAEGFTTVILLILISAGLIMLSLGVIGFYIARIYDEIKGRPRSIVAERCGGDGA